MSLYDNFQQVVATISQALNRKANKDDVDAQFDSVSTTLETKANKDELIVVFDAIASINGRNKPIITLNDGKTFTDVKNAYESGASVYIKIVSDNTNLGLGLLSVYFKLLNPIYVMNSDYIMYKFVYFPQAYSGDIVRYKSICTITVGNTSGGSPANTFEIAVGNYTDVYSELTGIPTFATVATSGLYSDLSGTPTLATVATSGSYNDLLNKPSLATVATSGSYNDLSNKPTIPTKTSDLTNDSGFVTSEVVVDGSGTAPATGNPIIWIQPNQSNSIIESHIKINNVWKDFVTNIEPIYTYQTIQLYNNYINCLALINAGQRPVLLYNGGLYRYSGASTLSPEGIVFTKVSDGSGSNSITIITILRNSPYISVNTVNLQSALPSGSSSNYILKWIYSNNKWDWGAGNLDTELSGKENTSNKVTSISSSSTDTQYPSAKLLYDTKTALETAFTITLTFTSQSGGTLDKTDAEIESAINSNKKIVMNILGEIYTGFDIICNDSDIYFYFTDDARTSYAVNIQCIRINRVSGSTTNAFTYYIDFLYGIANNGTTDGEYIKWDYANSYWTRSGIVPENVSNKVTSLSSSSTDTQYPSAKCVYDIIGDVETSLSTINTALAGLIGGNS